MEKSRKKKPPHDFVPLARDLRKNDTKAEKIAWTLLKDRRLGGYKFRRQVPIDKYIVDFYCHEARLIIELDGDVHAEDWQVEIDQKREARLKELGYNILHFPNDALYDDTGYFETTIRACLPSPSRASRGVPLPEGEGGEP